MTKIHNLFQKYKDKKVTHLGIGPMSKNCIDAAIEISNENDIPLMLIASRRQIDCKELGGGYVNNWSTEEFVNVAWDSAGVTTGPVTVPLVLAMGLGLGNAVSATEGFGILSMASICPILAVLLMGLFIQFQQKHKKKDN